MNQQQLARGLGWFSFGLGLAELLAPRKVEDAIGVEDHGSLLPWLGAREITSGIGLLSADQTTGWMWSRVVGDAMDLGLLAAAFKSSSTDRKKLGGAIAMVAGITALDLYSSVKLSRDGADRPRTNRERSDGQRPTRQAPVRKSIVINKPLEEVYSFWRKLENLPRFMNHLKSVREEGRRSHWVAKGPVGTEVSWDAEIVKEIPNEVIAWRSLPGSMVQNTGVVRFDRATGDRGTVLRVELEYRPPAGAVGATIAKLFGEAPEKQIPVDLRRIKQLLETGEIARTEGQSSGRSRSTSRRYDDFVRT